MTAPDKIASSRSPSPPPPGPEKQEKEPAPANLMEVDDGVEDEDEEVVFEGGAETVKDNPAFWGSSEANIGSTSEETPKESVSSRALPARGDSAPSDETRTVSGGLAPTRTGVPAANLPTRIARSVSEHVPSSLAAVHQLCQQRCGLVAAVGTALVVVVVGLVAVMTLSTSGGKTQSPSSSVSEAGVAMSELAAAKPVATDVLEQPGGILSIESEPIGASVLINGAKLGLTPWVGIDATRDSRAGAGELHRSAWKKLGTKPRN